MLYVRSQPGVRDIARAEAETILRLVRGVRGDEASDFTLSTSDQIIAQFDKLGAQLFLATLALAAVSLIIGGIGIANVMVMSVTERTREIGVRLAIGAQRREVLRQFLFEAAMLAGAGGVAGVITATALGLIATLIAPAFPAVPPLWAVASGSGHLGCRRGAGRVLAGAPRRRPRSGGSPPLRMSTTIPKVVVIGGGFAGLAAARELRRAAVQLTVVDQHNHHVFQPLLYQVATAGLSPADIAAPIRWVLRRQANVRVLLGEVVAIDASRRCVRLGTGLELDYDFLVVATGVTHAYFGHDDWAAHAPGLKTLDDAVAIRRRVLLAFERAEREPDAARQGDLLTFVVIGGGPTGVEMAGAIAEIARQSLRDEFDAIAPHSARVLLLEGGPTILSTYTEDLRASARRALTGLGVEVREQAQVTHVDEGEVRLGDERIAAGTIVWAAGVQASPVGRMLGAPVDRLGRVQVAADLSLPGHPEVFVAGDLMHVAGDDGQPVPGVAQAAMQAGKRAARNIERRLAGGGHRAVPLSRPGGHGHHRPRPRHRRPRLDSPHRVSRLAGVAVPPPGVPDRLQEPRGGAHPVARRLRDAPTRRQIDHRRQGLTGSRDGSRTNAVTYRSRRRTRPGRTSAN